MSDQQFKDTNNTFSPPDFPTIMINIKDDDRSHSTLHLNEISSPWRKGNDGSIFASPFTSRRVLNSTNETEDDVFTEVVDIRTEEEVEDKKLVDWATNVFIPACKSLLDQCCEEKVINSKIQMYLRLLSNTIVFFCNEHANIASNSRSTSELSSRGSMSPTRDTHLLTPGHRATPTTTKNETETTVGMKVLRSVSTSLLPPLLAKCSEEGFTENLHREIVLAIQKISWKVEACLSYSNPNVEYSIHKRIFDGLHGSKVLSMMIAPPPEEHKLQSPAHISKLTTKNATPSPFKNSTLPTNMKISLANSTPSPSSLSPPYEEDDDYFRPKATRRTTVSISKLQVQNLGLNMVDVATLDNHSLPRSNTIGISTAAKLVQDEGVLRLEAVRNKVLEKLAKEFPQLKSGEKEGVVTRPTALIPLNDLEEDAEQDQAMSYASTPMTLSPVTSCASSPFVKESSSPPTTQFSYDEQPRLKTRTKSLDFEQTSEVSSPMSPFTSSVSIGRRSPEVKHSHQTLPKRRGTIMKFLNKSKSKSFGRADTKIKQRQTVGHIRHKSASSEFFSTENISGRDSTSIEWYSRGAHPYDPSSQDSVYLNIEVLGKSTFSPRKRRFSVSSSKSTNRSSLLIDISVNTNSPEFELHEYTISRSFKDTITLYDILLSTTASANDFPLRPEKRGKDWRQQVEGFLSYVSNNPELRTIPEFMNFIKPGEMNVDLITSTHNDSEFDLLMTFYTPFSYPSGEPGSHFEVEHIKSTAASMVTTPSKPRYYFGNTKSSVMIERQEGEEETTFIIREGDRDALIVSETQNRCLIVAGTFEKLVERLACEEKPDPYYVNTFLLGYRHFSTSDDLLTLLIKQFQMTTAPDASEEDVAYAEKWRYVIQLRVLDILKYWISSCFPDFLLHPEVLDKLKGFIEQLYQSDDSNFTSAADTFSSLISRKVDAYHNKGTCRLSSSSSSRSPSMSPVHTTSSLSRKASITDIDSFTAIQIARQLTLMELDYLKSIDIYELAIYTWENSDESKQFRKNLDAYIARFNQVSYWVATEVLSMEDEKLRASLIEKFIEMAKHCQELRNFNTTVSLVTGLSLSSIRRLGKTWKQVNEKLVKSFMKLRQLVNPANNHHDYRKSVSIAKSGCIPYFGVFMRDVTLCNYGNPKKLKNGLYNFSKLRILVQMFEEVYQYQKSKHYYPSDDRAQMYCSNLRCLEEHDLYELSLKLEPRESSICESD